MAKKTPAEIRKRVDALSEELGVWRTHWQELYDYILPRKAVVVTKQYKGTKRGIDLYDNTALVSCEILAGALHGMLTNPNQQWFELRSSVREINEIKEVKVYLQELTKRMHDVLNKSNFQTEVHELYLDLCSIGTGVMDVQEDDERIVNFNTRFVDEIRMAENSRGIIEEVYREFKWDAFKIYDKFNDGIKLTEEDKLISRFGREVANCLKAGDYKTKFCVIHSVYRKDILSDEAFPFISQYTLKEQEIELSESGYRSFPYLTPRWTKLAGEVWGRSPGMNALPEAKTLNLMAKTVIKGAQKTVDPPLQVPDDGFTSLKKTTPGSFHYYRAGTRDRAEPIYNDARIDFGFEAMRERQMQIRSAFFVDRLNLPMNDRMTTVEANQRIEEQFRFLGPMLGRQQIEFLAPLVDRVLDIMIRRDVDGDLIGQPPEILLDNELDVVYTSPIARAQRIDQGQSLLRAWEATTLIAEAKPEALDNIDADEYVKSVWETFGANERVLLSNEKVDAIRDARAEAQQQAVQQNQEMVQTEQISKLSKV